MKRMLVVLAVAGMLDARGAEVPSSPAAVSPCLEGGRVRWIIPVDTGGSYDTFMRLLAPFYEGRLGARLACENVTEAGGLVAAQKLHEAPPDGRTLGILNSTVLLTRRLSGEAGVPNLASDYTLLARVDRSQHVWVTAARSELRTMEEVFRVAAQRPLVLGLREVGASSFASFALGADLLDLPYEMVTGFTGSREAMLSALRGEVDLLSLNFESVIKSVEAGDLRVLLQVSDRPVAQHAALRGVPLLGGPDGLAVARAKRSGRDAAAAVARASALSGLVGSGRLLAAPPGMDPTRTACLRAALHQTLAAADFRAAAERSQIVLEVGTAEAARAELVEVERQFEVFRPVFERAIQRVRR